MPLLFSIAPIEDEYFLAANSLSPNCSTDILQNHLYLCHAQRLHQQRFVPVKSLANDVAFTTQLLP